MSEKVKIPKLNPIERLPLCQAALDVAVKALNAAKRKGFEDVKQGALTPKQAYWRAQMKFNGVKFKADKLQKRLDCESGAYVAKIYQEKRWLYALFFDSEHSVYIGQTLDYKRRTKYHATPSGGWGRPHRCVELETVLGPVSWAISLEWVWRSIAQRKGWSVFMLPPDSLMTKDAYSTLFDPNRRLADEAFRQDLWDKVAYPTDSPHPLVGGDPGENKKPTM